MVIHMHVSGVYPRPPALLLRDDSDADDACDAVLRISLYHNPGFSVIGVILILCFFVPPPLRRIYSAGSVYRIADGRTAGAEVGGY